MTPQDIAGGTDADEVEWQFDAPELDRVAAWLAGRPAAAEPRAVAGPIIDQIDDYFDDADWRIYRAGFTLRLRRRAGRPAEATLKALAVAPTQSPAAASPDTALRARREINEPLDLSDPADVDHAELGQRLRVALVTAPGPVGAWLRATLGDRSFAALVPLVTVQTHRTVFDLYKAGAVVGEVALDRTRFHADGREVASLRRVELETSGSPAALDPFVRALAAACELVPAGASKFEVGLAAASRTPPVAEAR